MRAHLQQALRFELSWAETAWLPSLEGLLQVALMGPVNQLQDLGVEVQLQILKGLCL